MLQPADLKSDQKLLWSPGRGTDLWTLFQACIAGDVNAVRALIGNDPSLARAHFDYRKPLYFAVRENRIEVVRFLLDHDSNPIDLWVDDSPLEIARDRGYVEMERMLREVLDATFNVAGSTSLTNTAHGRASIPDRPRSGYLGLLPDAIASVGRVEAGRCRLSGSRD